MPSAEVSAIVDETVTSIDQSGLERIPIITYHSLDNSGSVVSTRPDLFRQQMTTLRSNGYQTLTLGELTKMTSSGKWPSQKSVILTFDDGFENFYDEAAPVLEEHGFTATVFLVTEKCGEYNDWAGNPVELPRSRLLSWSQIKELSGRGIEFGSHTVTHPDLALLNSASRQHELIHSKHTIEDATGKSVESFAYPFGSLTLAVKRAVQETYSSAVSTNLGRVGPQSDVYCLERLDAYYLSNPKSLEMLQSRLLDGYFSVRQLLRDIKGVVKRSSSRETAGSN